MKTHANLQAVTQLVAEVRRLDPEMKIQTLETLLRVAMAGRSGLHMTELQRQARLSLASTSRNVSTLSKVNTKGVKAWGFVEALEDPADRRYKIVYLTARGREFVDKLATIIGGSQ